VGHKVHKQTNANQSMADLLDSKNGMYMIMLSGFGTKQECFRSNQSMTIICLEAVGVTREKSFRKLKLLKNQNILVASPAKHNFDQR